VIFFTFLWAIFLGYIVLAATYKSVLRNC